MINLREKFGEQFRITFDESYDHKGIRVKDPAYMQIPCRLGTIYPFGGDYLCLEIDNHPGASKKISKITGIELVQDGQKEKTFKFPVSVFEEIAIIVVPKKKRKLNLTDEQKQAFLDRVAKGKDRKTL